MEDVREAENDGSDDQSCPLILESARKQILQQPAKQKFLGPRGEK